MAKKQYVQTITDKAELAHIAEKFGKIPTSIKTSSEIISQGYLTQEEYNNLPWVPRSTPMTCATSWCFIGGRCASPLTGVLSPEENEMYNNYHKEHSRSGSGTSNAVGTLCLKEHKNQKEIDEIREALSKAKMTHALELFNQLFPLPVEDTEMKKYFGVQFFSQLGGKVNMERIMYRKRDKDGNVVIPSELEPDTSKLLAQGFMPVYSVTEIKNFLAKLKAKAGIDLYNCITNLDKYNW